MSKQEWTFRIELVPIQKLFADPKYQRPPQTLFVTKLVETFDPTLVGTLDVSARADGRYALLDGLQRHSALTKLNYEDVWCAIYDGMSISDEASFFYRRNRDRRSVHPYYQFRARVLMGEDLAKGVDRAVRAQEFKLHVNANPDDHISAIRAAEDAYTYSSLTRPESLTPALRAIRASMYGRKGAKDGNLIRGLGRFFQSFSDDEIDYDHLYDVLAEVGPMVLIGRVADRSTYKGAGGGKGSSLSFAREIAELYNKGFNRKLPLRQISGSPRKK